MEKKRRADILTVSLRWLVMTVAMVSVYDRVPHVGMMAIMAVVVTYSGILTCIVANASLYVRTDRRLATYACLIDVVIVTGVVAIVGLGRSEYLLYWFPLVIYGFNKASLKKLIYLTVGVLVANAGASTYALGAGVAPVRILSLIGLRSVALIFGFIISAIIAGTRSQDERACERASYLHAIQMCAARLTGFNNVRDLALYVLRTVVTETNARGAYLLLVNEESQNMELEVGYTTGESSQTDSEAQEPSLAKGDVISPFPYAKWVQSTRRELVIRAQKGDSEDEVPASVERSIVAMPLSQISSGGESSILGVLVAWSTTDEDFGEDEVDIVRIFAAMSAMSIVSLRLYTNLQTSFLRTLQSLAKGLEARDEYTQGHSDRVMQVACLIGEQLELPTESIDMLRNASLLHDIGKIGVPDGVLRKPGKLSSEEWEVMRKHPVVGEEICKPLGLPDDVLFLVKHHHEHLDGKGYPSGLSAAEQPLLQRILVVADVYDAMRSRRSYRDAMPKEELRIELMRGAGRTMDPTVVDVLLHLLDSDELDSIYEEHDRTIGRTFMDDLDMRKAA